MMMALRSNCKWAAAFRRRLTNCLPYNCALPRPMDPHDTYVDAVAAALSNFEHSINCAMIKEASESPSLRLYTSLRSWTPIPTIYASSKSMSGKQGYRYTEQYLNAWPDKLGVRLKAQARLGCLWWRYQTSLHNKGLSFQEDFCDLCRDQTPQTLLHLVFECKGTILLYKNDPVRVWSFYNVIGCLIEFWMH